MPTCLPDDYAERQFEVQQGRCAVAGVPFHMERFSDALVKHPFAPSIDRKKSKGGYTPGNARLVCVGVNFGMGQWGQELYMRLARAAVKYEAEGKTEPAEVVADDWIAQQRDKIAGAEKVLSLIRVNSIPARRARLRACDSSRRKNLASICGGSGLDFIDAIRGFIGLILEQHCGDIPIFPHESATL